MPDASACCSICVQLMYDHHAISTAHVTSCMTELCYMLVGMLKTSCEQCWLYLECGDDPNDVNPDVSVQVDLDS